MSEIDLRMALNNNQSNKFNLIEESNFAVNNQNNCDREEHNLKIWEIQDCSVSISQTPCTIAQARDMFRKTQIIFQTHLIVGNGPYDWHQRIYASVFDNWHEVLPHSCLTQELNLLLLFFFEHNNHDILMNYATMVVISCDKRAKIKMLTKDKISVCNTYTAMFLQDIIICISPSLLRAISSNSHFCLNTCIRRHPDFY